MATTKQRLQATQTPLLMPNVLDVCEPGPWLSDEVVKPPTTVSKATMKRCATALAGHWTPKQSNTKPDRIARLKYPGLH